MGNTKKTKPATARATTTAAKPYNTYLDVLKGFAIILVVLGHSVQSYAADGRFDENLLFRIIYSFHMPLFMFLSGAAAAYSLRPMNFEFLKRKFYMLVIPFLSWYVIGYYLTGAHAQETFVTYAHKLIVSPDNGLWFLWVLFLNFCCLAAAKKLQKYFGLYSYVLVWLAIYALPTGKYGVGLVKWHLPFFVIGYLIFLYRESLIRYRNVALAFCVVSYPILVASWHRLYMPSPVTHLNGHLAAHNLANISLGGVININTYQIATLGYIYLVPFAGIGFVYWLFRLRPAKFMYRPLAFLGLYTLDIYVVHFYFLQFAIGHSWLEIGSGFVIALFLALALGFVVLRRVPILSHMLLGGRSKQKPLFARWQRAT